MSTAENNVQPLYPTSCGTCMSRQRCDHRPPPVLDDDRSDELTDDHDDGVEDSWTPADLTAFLDGTYVAPQPSVGWQRADGRYFLYPGLEHAAIGESEGGKSWFALLHCAAELTAGNRVVYVHFEEAFAASCVVRLLLLGVPARRIRTDFLFVGPERQVRAGDITRIIGVRPPTLVVLDGVNEAMALHNQDIMKPDGAADYRRLLVRPFKRAGAAILSLDHVVKDANQKGGGYAAGAGHKLNGLDGAQFLIENIEPFGEGQKGASAVAVVKDRHGKLRQYGIADKRVTRKTRFAVMSIDGTEPGGVAVTLYAAKEGDNTGGGLDSAREEAAEAQARAALDQEVFEVVARLELQDEYKERGPSGRAVRALVPRAPAAVGHALERLQAAGRVTSLEKGTATYWRSKGVPSGFQGQAQQTAL